MPSLEDYLSRPMTAPDQAVLDAIERGPIDHRQAQAAGDVDALLDPAELLGECGWFADENLGARPARFVSDESLRRLDELRARYDPDGRFHSWMGRPG